MQPVRKILLAVKNPDRRRQTVDKAIRLAKKLGASLEFFHAIAEPVLLEIQPLTGNSLAGIKRQALLLRQKRPDRLVARACELGVDSHGTVEWDFSPHEAIVRHAVRCHADLIVTECHEGRRHQWLMRLTDWELLRSSPVPVLLLKTSRPWRRHIVLAAVDPSHAHSKPSRLDSLIVERGQQLAGALGGSLHLMHAAYPSAFGLTLGDPAIDGMTLAAAYEQQKAKAREGFTEFANSMKMPRNRRHVVDRGPATGISAVAKELGADVVVMGAVSRSGIKRLLIGNTAERVTATSRGMRVVASQPLVPCA